MVARTCSSFLSLVTVLDFMLSVRLVIHFLVLVDLLVITESLIILGEDSQIVQQLLLLLPELGQAFLDGFRRRTLWNRRYTSASLLREVTRGMSC
jgi:hypothetical protein